MEGEGLAVDHQITFIKTLNYNSFSNKCGEIYMKVETGKKKGGGGGLPFSICS